MDRHWLRTFSPCVIVGFFTLLLIIRGLFENENMEGWGMIGVVILGPFLLFLIFIDVLAKGVLKLNEGQIWLVEMIIILLAVFVFWFFRINWLQI